MTKNRRRKNTAENIMYFFDPGTSLNAAQSRSEYRSGSESTTRIF